MLCDKHHLHRFIMEGMLMSGLKDMWLKFLMTEQREDTWWERKKALCERRNIKIVHIHGEGRTYRILRYQDNMISEYLLHIALTMKQHDDTFYMEEKILPYQLHIKNGEIVNHKINSLTQDVSDHQTVPSPREFHSTTFDARFSYDRRAAVKYAERWWNSYNPDFRYFSVDCTNYVSQCLLAGGAPMRGGSDRSKGWWYRYDNWSYSWAVAHSMRWYLSGSNEGLKGREVETAEELQPGDVICYDFQGDGRWDHTTFVVSKDANNMPLVNAHTDNSRHRYWSYEDSTAWTPQIKYKFFKIGQ